MKSISIILLSSILFLSCGTEPNSDSTPANLNVIMPVGDSRVQGAHPVFESYRYELWKLLINSEVAFDLAGYRQDQSVYAEYKGEMFDPDHAGVSGYTSTDVLNSMTDIIKEVPNPDIVLLGIGGNDLLGGATPQATVDNIREIIGLFRASEDSVVIILEQIAPGKSEFMETQDEEEFANFNTLVLNLGLELSTNASPIIVVDMAEGWQDTYLSDNIHYNQAGAEVVAQRYFTAMVPFLEE